jgi:hypothetical protein
MTVSPIILLVGCLASLYAITLCNDKYKLMFNFSTNKPIEIELTARKLIAAIRKSKEMIR